MKYAAFLRAVNVAGKQVSMSALKAMLSELGFDNAQSLLQSGNLVFDARQGRPAELEALLESQTERRLSIRTEYFIRDGKELVRVIAGNPFRREAQDDPARLVVVFLKKAPVAKDVAALQSGIKGPEVIETSGRHLYITYPDGQGRSKLTNAVIEKTLNTRGTARNWNTVLKVAGALK
jgi:uncharacterized protein (DUF1697 family)